MALRFVLDMNYESDKALLQRSFVSESPQNFGGKFKTQPQDMLESSLEALYWLALWNN